MRLVRLVAVWLPIFAVLGFAGVTPVSADEGMWLFTHPPRQRLQQKYGFDPTDAWLTHLQQSSVRFNSGGSGSFVSSQGLVMTNHHVAADALQKLSSPERNLLRDGFYARSRDQELKCPDLELNVLVSVEDVSGPIKSAVPAGATIAEAEQARRAAMNRLEQESLEKTGLRSDVVTLYRGGLYHLYRYRKYTDVRLAFAPEQAIAFFGGDPDNFEYPRFDLDVTFFRVYEDGQPARVPHFLAWSPAGAAAGDLVFVSGHPGHTDRLDTVAHLEFLRDRLFPWAMQKVWRREVLLSTYSQRGLENARRARDELFGYQNSRKARLGMLAGLQDPAVISAKRREESDLQDQLRRNPALQESIGDPWAQVAQATQAWNEILLRHDLLERGAAFNSDLFSIARQLVRLVEETAKPNPQRLREYRQSNLESLRQALFSEAPIYPDLETVKLADSLSMGLELAGADHELVQQVLDGQSPAQRAAQLVQGTRVAEVAFRKTLAEGGLDALQACDDPLIRLARLVDAPAREVRQVYEQQVDEALRQAYEKLADARFALIGTDLYPDATFTLRLAFGEVRGYQQPGQAIPPFTTLGGAFQHAEQHGSQEPFALPPSWLQRRDRLALDTPLNFICTADIIGGNSGSPVVNRQGEVVGLIFDGNLPSLVWDFVFSQEQGRAVAVDSRAIRQTLRDIYEAAPLADELGN